MAVIFGFLVMFLLFSFFSLSFGMGFKTTLLIMLGMIAVGVYKFLSGMRQQKEFLKNGGTVEELEQELYRKYNLPNPKTTQREQTYWRMTWQEFELSVEKYFNRLGYATIHRGQTGDKGVDIEAYSLIDDTHVIIQCKHYSSKVGSVDVQKLAGAMMAHKADKAFLVTSSDFTDQAYEFASMCRNLTLIPGKTLAETRERI